MNQNSYLQFVRNSGVFWRSVQSWVKWAIVLVGVFIGLSVWFSGLSALFPVFALIFLGSTTSALVLKILIALGVVVSLPIIVIAVAWLLYMIVFLATRFIVMANEDAPMGEFIFKTDQ